MEEETVPWSDYFYEMGKYLGYPKCCIYEFIWHGNDEPACPKEVHKGYGFIPCTKHTNEILADKIELEDLITNRICPTPFPNHDEDEAEEYVKKILKL
jgi:hypothetical protein